MNIALVQPELLAEVAEAVRDVTRENILYDPGGRKIFESVSFLRDGGPIDLLGEFEEKVLSSVVGESILSEGG